MSEISFQCGGAKWRVQSITRWIVDPVVRLVIYRIDACTTQSIGLSSLRGQHGRLSQGATILAESLVLHAVYVHQRHGAYAFQIHIQALAGPERGPSGGTEISRDEARDHELRGPLVSGPLPALSSVEFSDVEEFRLLGTTARLPQGRLDVALGDEPLFRETTVRLLPDELEGTATSSYRSGRTELLELDELERSHRAKCVEKELEALWGSMESPSRRHAGDDGALLWELARVFHEREQASFLVVSAGFPRARIPEFRAPLAFWGRVLEEIHNGVLRGGLPALIEHAVQMYPSNRIFAYHRSIRLCRA